MDVIIYIILIMCIRSINDIRIEKCHNGCYKRYEWHKRYKISIYSSQTWKLTARDRGRGSSARHPGDVGPSMNHVEVAAGGSLQPSQPQEVRRADALTLKSCRAAAGEEPAGAGAARVCGDQVGPQPCL